MASSWTKKTILITGAGTGIGKDAAFALAARGHRVIATTETEEQASALRAEAEKRGRAMDVWKLDITVRADREKVAGYDLDVLINNAAIGESGPLADVPADRLRRSYEVNVVAPLALTQTVVRNMAKRGGGTVLFVSSLAGRAPMPFVAPYSMTKFALSGGVAAFREELRHVARRVRVSLIEPGAYHTGFNQRMLATKYEWMDEQSLFYRLLPALRARDARFLKIEQRSTRSIVSQIVRAAEARRPRLRYTAPWHHGLYIRIVRMFGV